MNNNLFELVSGVRKDIKNKKIQTDLSDMREAEKCFLLCFTLKDEP